MPHNLSCDMQPDAYDTLSFPRGTDCLENEHTREESDLEDMPAKRVPSFGNDADIYFGTWFHPGVVDLTLYWWYGRAIPRHDEQPLVPRRLLQSPEST